jgi:putative redox protein
MSRQRTATLVHEGGMRFVATTGTTRTIVHGDDHEANELSPVETLVVNLGACSAMDVVSIAAKKRQHITSYRIHLDATQRDEYPQVLTNVVVTHEVEGPVVEVAAIRRSIELSALKYCPVSAMLCAGTVELHHRYRIHRDGAAPEEGEVLTLGPGYNPAPDEVATHH